MGLINSLAKRAYSISFLSVSMTSEITYEVSGGEEPVYSPITASVVLITAKGPPLTYHRPTVNEGIAKLASYTAFTLPR